MSRAGRGSLEESTNRILFAREKVVDPARAAAIGSRSDAPAGLGAHIGRFVDRMLGIDDVEELTGGGALDVGRGGDEFAACGPEVLFLPGLHRCFSRPPVDATTAGTAAGGTGPLLTRLSIAAFLAGATRLAPFAVALGAKGGEVEVGGPGQRRFELGAIGSQRRGELAELLRGEIGMRFGRLLPELLAGVAGRSHPAEGELPRGGGEGASPESVVSASSRRRTIAVVRPSGTVTV